MKEVAIPVESEPRLGTGTRTVGPGVSSDAFEREAGSRRLNLNTHNSSQEQQWLHYQPDLYENQDTFLSGDEERRRLNSGSRREVRSLPATGAESSATDTEAQVTERRRSSFRWTRPLRFLRPSTRRRRNSSASVVDSAAESSESDSESVMSMSMPLSDPNYDVPQQQQQHARIVDVMEKRSQKTYKYGLGLVCVGATLNWLSFVQGQDSLDLLRYMGITCIVTGALCACLGICRWIGRPLPMPCHRVCDHSQLGSQNGQLHPREDVHVIDVPVSAYADANEDFHHPSKPPDYEIVIAGEPPPYDEAIKLDPNALLGPQLHFYSGSDLPQEGSSKSPCRCPPSSHSSQSTFVVVSSAAEAGAASSLPPDATLEVNDTHQPATISLSESMRNSVQNQNQGGDAAEVMVDASEPSSYASSISGASHTKSYGAPPPYTKEYTPSPRRTAPNSVMPTPEHVATPGSSSNHYYNLSNVSEETAASGGTYGIASGTSEVNSRLMSNAFMASIGSRSHGSDEAFGEMTPVDIMVL